MYEIVRRNAYGKLCLDSNNTVDTAQAIAARVVKRMGAATPLVFLYASPYAPPNRRPVLGIDTEPDVGWKGAKQVIGRFTGEELMEIVETYAEMLL